MSEYPYQYADRIKNAIPFSDDELDMRKSGKWYADHISTMSDCELAYEHGRLASTGAATGIGDAEKWHVISMGLSMVTVETEKRERKDGKAVDHPRGTDVVTNAINTNACYGLRQLLPQRSELFMQLLSVRDKIAELDRALVDLEEKFASVDETVCATAYANSALSTGDKKSIIEWRYTVDSMHGVPYVRYLTNARPGYEPTQRAKNAVYKLEIKEKR